MKILLLSGYDADSHQFWRLQLEKQFPEHEWTQLALPARYFQWRIRGSGFIWGQGDYPELECHYDLIVVTSMVDWSCLRGMRPNLANIPCVVYFHENQFAYPMGQQQDRLEPKLVNLYSACCADQLWFNSRFNRDTFLQGARQLLSKMPDYVPPNFVERLQAISKVVSVPLADASFQPLSATRAQSELPEFIWNHRWEYDKGPEVLLGAVRRLIGRNLKFRLHVVGQQFRRQPEAFETLKQMLEGTDRMGHWGYLENINDYHALLSRCHWVVSSAHHDFQGLAVMEAVAKGCIPIVPGHQAYPEWFGADCYEFEGEVEQDSASLALKMSQAIEAWPTLPWDEAAQAKRAKVNPIKSFIWSEQRSIYESALGSVFRHTAP